MGVPWKVLRDEPQIHGLILRGKRYEDHALELFRILCVQKFSNLTERNVGCAFDGVTIDARRDGGESDVFQSMLCRQLQTNAIATRQLQRRARTLGVIDRTNGVNDVLRWKVVAGGDASLSSWTAT